MIELFLDQASSFADDIDFVITLIAVLVGFWWLLTEGILFSFILKFRKKGADSPKAQYITGEKKSDKKFITLAHTLVLICDVAIIIAAIQVWYDVKQVLPEPQSVVRVSGQQWTWSFRHPGQDNELDTADDIVTTDELNLELGKVYHYELQADDVLHSFSVPAFRLKQDAVPGRTITGWFQPTKVGTYDLQCAEMCGIGHGIMAARVMVRDKTAHGEWLAMVSATQ